MRDLVRAVLVKLTEMICSPDESGEWEHEEFEPFGWVAKKDLGR